MKHFSTTKTFFILVLITLSSETAFSGSEKAIEKIDRKTVVERHCAQVNEKTDITSLGNGEFAFNCDATGLQTFAGNTMSHWGWHSYPAASELPILDRPRFPIDSNGRIKNYLAPTPDEFKPLIRWLYDNPHRMNLCRLAFRGRDGQAIRAEEIEIVSRRYDIWNGKVESRFLYLGRPVEVVTVCHPKRDAVSVRIESDLLKDGRLLVACAFPYPVPLQRRALIAGDFLKQDGHETVVDEKTYEGALSVTRIMDDRGRYHVFMRLNDLRTTMPTTPPEDLSEKHAIYLRGDGSATAELTLLFTCEAVTENASDYDLSEKCLAEAVSAPNFDSVLSDASEHWTSFWRNGAFVDFSGSRDPRWFELERRVLLSQFLTAIHSSGSKPPAEAGLYFVDPWCGKFHLEMTAWHGAHFFFWNRPTMIDGWKRWYRRIGLPAAKKEAEAEGWKGAKWLKTPDPYGRWESWEFGPHRITQNTHPFYLAELSYRAQPTRETLLEWKEILFETTEMMIDFLYWDEKSKRYLHGPPVMTGAEGDRGFRLFNSTSELNYLAMSIDIARKWRQRLDLEPDTRLEHIAKHLSRPPVVDGVYVDAESHPAIWIEDVDGRMLRPAWLEVYGCIRGPLIDPEIMRKTYERISGDLKSGKWKRNHNLWGCDFPMLAMTAARLGKPEEAVDWLLYDIPHNHYTTGGYNWHWYLPGNGGLLWAVALMTAGWEDGPADIDAPGFPTDGSWTIRHEGLLRVP